MALYRYAYRLSGAPADAEDLTQETFCKAQSQLSQLRDIERARSWLFSILRNTYLQRLRKENRLSVALDDVGELPDPAPDEDLPEIDQEELQKVLDEMPEAFRTPVLLYYFEEFSYRDIAEQMELPIGTVMSRLSRAKAYLRRKLLTADSALLSNQTFREA